MSYTFKSEDVLDFADSIRADVHIKGDELVFKYCPYCEGGRHNDRETFSVNLDSGAFCCLRASCSMSGHFVELARDFNFQLDFEEPKVYKRLSQKPVSAAPSAVSYLETRGIGRAITEKYKISCLKNDPATIAFPFYDDTGELVFAKYRRTVKQPGERKHMKEWSEPGAKPILFGMMQCEDFSRLVITEGQIDSLSVAEAGIKNAVSVPNGANGFTWLPHCIEWLSKFNDVVVFGDNEHGKITLYDTLKTRLPQQVKRVRRVDYLGEKDANDILRKYGRNAVAKCVEKAEVPKMPNVKDLSSVEAIDLNNLPKIYSNIQELDRVTGGLAFGQLVLLTGKRGKGKSTLASQLLADALDQAQSIFAYSGELADFHFKSWLDLQLAGASNTECVPNAWHELEYYVSDAVLKRISAWYKGRAYIYDNSYIPEDGEEYETLADTIERAIMQYNVSVVLIDNLMTAMECIPSNDNLYQAQSNFVLRLQKIVKKHKVLIILVAHRRKGSGDFDNDDVSGSGNITDAADIVMSYERNEAPHGEQGDTSPGGRLTVSKNRLSGKLAVGDHAINLYYDAASKRIFGASNRDKHYGWESVKPFENAPDIYNEYL